MLSSTPTSSKFSKKVMKDMQITERARVNPQVHRQLVQQVEEDPVLIESFTRHLEKKYSKQWPTLSKEQKNKILKETIKHNRIPIHKTGGKRKTRKSRKINKRKINKRKTNNRKTNKNIKKLKKTRRK